MSNYQNNLSKPGKTLTVFILFLAIAVSDSFGGNEFPYDKLGAGIGNWLDSSAKSDDKLRVIAILADKNLSLPKKRFEVETRHGNQIQLKVNRQELQQLAALDMVQYIRLPHYARPKATMTESLEILGAEKAHLRGNLGRGARVAVLDVGFYGYGQLRGQELPWNMQAENFHIEGFELSAHGTGVAEIIHDIAPEASLVLVAFNTEVEYLNALDWIVAQEPPIHIVNASIGFDNTGPLNGKSPISQAASDMLAEHGILYLNAAGNEQQQYYSARFNDPDGDGWHNFSGDDEHFAVELNKLEPFEIILNWDDWGNNPASPRASTDYDLFLWCPGTTQFTEQSACASSTASQNGGHQQAPLEEIHTPSPKGGAYQMGIKKRHGSNKRIRVFFYNDAGTFGLEYRTAESTLTLPADGQYVTAVGAHDFLDPLIDVNTSNEPNGPYTADDWQHELPVRPYSSLGPTWDGRTKPDISGPDGVSTQAYGELGFYGTSAATPHVAGVAALLKSEVKARDGHELRRLLLGTSQDVLPRGADNQHGAGRVSMETINRRPLMSGYTGFWHDPTKSGHGITIDRQGSVIAAMWFVYDDDGQPLWLMAPGQVTDGIFTAEVYEVTGPQLVGNLSSLFNPEGSTIAVTEIGQLQAHFERGSKAFFEIDLAGSDRISAASYQLELEPLLIDVPAGIDNTPYLSDQSGFWHNPAENGHGFFIMRQGDRRSPDANIIKPDFMAAVWYSYSRTEQQSSWYLSSGLNTTGNEYSSAGQGFDGYNMYRFELQNSSADAYLSAIRGNASYSRASGSMRIDKLRDIGSTTVVFQPNTVSYFTDLEPMYFFEK